MKIYEHYGNGLVQCSCCGEKEVRFLSVDHINQNGADHRREIGGGHLYNWLVKNNFPEGFQILCLNCNHGRFLNAGICPHKSMV